MSQERYVMLYNRAARAVLRLRAQGKPELAAQVGDDWLRWTGVRIIKPRKRG
jgi:hypothetical protein